MPDSPRLPNARLQLFPITTEVSVSGTKSELTIAHQGLNKLADQYGTPLYLYDQATLDANLDGYRQSLSHHYPGRGSITYAGKAFLCLAMAQWVKWQGISLDCSSAGEMHMAEQVGLSRQQIVCHGVNKSPADLQAAIHYAGTIVVDNWHELKRLISIQDNTIKSSISFPDIWLRLRPGVQVQTHHHIQTGQSDSKFGFSPDEFIQAIEFCQAHNIAVKGIHFHLGSHLRTPEPFVLAMEIALKLIQECYRLSGWLPKVVCPGGGWAVPYHETDLPPMAVENMVAGIAETLINQCHVLHLPLFDLQLEPGRSLIARAGVAVYRIGAVKNTLSRRYLLLDGGIADNPRPALYQARYSALPVLDPLQLPTNPIWLAGSFCESGDVLIEGLPLPELEPGGLIAIPVSGAYQLSMASNYNGACRPAVLWLQDQKVQLIQSRENVADLVRRDLPLITLNH